MPMPLADLLGGKKSNLPPSSPYTPPPRTGTTTTKTTTGSGSSSNKGSGSYSSRTSTQSSQTRTDYEYLRKVEEEARAKAEERARKAQQKAQADAFSKMIKGSGSPTGQSVMGETTLQSQRRFEKEVTVPERNRVIGNIISSGKNDVIKNYAVGEPVIVAKGEPYYGTKNGQEGMWQDYEKTQYYVGVTALEENRKQSIRPEEQDRIINANISIENIGKISKAESEAAQARIREAQDTALTRIYSTQPKTKQEEVKEIIEAKPFENPVSKGLGGIAEWGKEQYTAAEENSRNENQVFSGAKTLFFGTVGGFADIASGVTSGNVFALSKLAIAPVSYAWESGKKIGTGQFGVKEGTEAVGAFIAVKYGGSMVKGIGSVSKGVLSGKSFSASLTKTLTASSKTRSEAGLFTLAKEVRKSQERIKPQETVVEKELNIPLKKGGSIVGELKNKGNFFEKEKINYNLEGKGLINAPETSSVERIKSTLYEKWAGEVPELTKPKPETKAPSSEFDAWGGKGDKGGYGGGGGRPSGTIGRQTQVQVQKIIDQTGTLTRKLGEPIKNFGNGRTIKSTVSFFERGTLIKTGATLGLMQDTRLKYQAMSFDQRQEAIQGQFDLTKPAVVTIGAITTETALITGQGSSLFNPTKTKTPILETPLVGGGGGGTPDNSKYTSRRDLGGSLGAFLSGGNGGGGGGWATGKYKPSLIGLQMKPIKSSKAPSFLTGLEVRRVLR